MGKRIKLTCDYCGKSIERYQCQLHRHNFCCKKCASDFTSKTANPEHYEEARNLEPISRALSETNRRLNGSRMTPETREKVSQGHIRLRKENTTYYKYHGRHVHRQVAEEMLGRPLKPGEVVHHIDGNRHNNAKENLMIFKNQAEHAKWHAKHRKGGD